MYQIILTIISALGAFCAFYLLGSSRQKDKDERTLKEYKAEAEAVILKSKQETAEAKAKEEKSETERTILNETAKIVRNPVIREKGAEPKTVNELVKNAAEEFKARNAELRRQTEEVETEDDALDVLDAMKADSDRRAEVLGRRYEES